MKDNARIEYKVREIKRYVVTRWTGEEVADENRQNVKYEGTTQSQITGEYPNWDTAYAVAYALCKAEHDRLGLPPGDDRIQYPISVPNGTVLEIDPEFHSSEEIKILSPCVVNAEGEMESMS